MKLALISDAHLGYKTGRKTNDKQVNLREEDGYRAFDECIDGIIKNNIDIVVIAGDLFHSPNPTINTLVKAKKSLERLANERIPVYIITGNHDTADIKFDHSSSVLMDNKLNGIYSYQKPIVIEEIGNIRLYLVSHQSTESQLETFNNIELDEDYINILVTHGSCFDSNIGEILHTENEPREVIIPEKTLDLNWDYILMGHIHTRGWVHSKDGLTDTENKKQFYGGSLIRRGFADKECKLGRGWTMFDIDEDTKNIKVKMFNIWQRPQHDFSINCKDKKIIDINNELENIVNNIEDELPIVRITFYGIKPSHRKSLDFNSIKDKTDSFLSFIVRYKEKEQKETSGNTEYNIERNDIISDYNRFWEEEKEVVDEDIREETKEKSEDYIKRGIKKVSD